MALTRLARESTHFVKLLTHFVMKLTHVAKALKDDRSGSLQNEIDRSNRWRTGRMPFAPAGFFVFDRALLSEINLPLACQHC